jgi:hypothetical protein
MKKTFLFISCIAFFAFAAPPPDVPGEVLSNETIFNHITRNSAILNSRIQTETEHECSENLNRSSRHTIPIHDQIAMDTTSIQFGMGAVFVPRMSEPGNDEPFFYIYDSEDNRVEIGEVGRKINLPPGTYTLEIIEKTPFNLSLEFEVRPSEITPIAPTWSAVRIEVIDESGKPIRGEYDLALLDPLMAVGRGHGRDINLAEDLRVWYLPVGYYKILGVGSALNSISNFLTFQIAQTGEIIRFTIVQDPDTRRILGGGTLLDDIIAGERRLSNWHHSTNIGGSVDFNYYKDDFSDTVSNLTHFSFLLYDRMNYRKNKLEVTNLIKLDLGLTIEDMDLKTLKTTGDELRILSLFTFRLLPRFGPYLRNEFSSSLFRKNAEFSSLSRKRENFRHAFIIFEKVPEIIDDDSKFRIDNTSLSFQTSPTFSPIRIQLGGGANFQVLKNSTFDLRFLSGLGIEYEKQWGAWRIVPERNLNFDSSSNIYRNIYDSNIERITLEKNDGERLDVGPEFMLNYLVYLTRFITLDGELRFFIPFERFTSPYVRWHTLLSFRVTRFLSIDYDYTFNLIEANQEELRTKSNKHRILARFSFARR